MNNKFLSVAVLTIFILSGCSGAGSDKLLSPDKINFDTEINTNTLKVIKKKGGNIEEIEYIKAVIENAGTDKEKICLCQTVAFRVAQLASQAWKDGVFRCYDVKEIRTGWNTDGIYEFFSDEEFSGEKGDLEIPSSNIKIENRNGGEPVSGTMLTVKDSWYKIVLSNGLKLNFTGTEGKDGIYTSRFLKLRSEFKKGKKSVKRQMASERKKVEANLQKTPFNRITMVIE